MNVFMVGGTGLLGSEGARELLRRGHAVSSIALPPLPEGAGLPAGMRVEFSNYLEMSDDELRRRMDGCEGLVFAAGVDERVEGPAPIYAMFERYNITPLERLLRLAKGVGVRRAVVCGSYFSYFDRVWPEKRLYGGHPYIRSRVDQARMALSFAGDGFDVAVLELPYIFGAQPGRKPVWTFLVDSVRRMRPATLYPRGGTTMVTVRQVGQCIAGALERNRGGTNYPIGYYNLTWRGMLSIVHRHMGMPDRKVVTIPDWLFRAACAAIRARQRKAGLEGGLDPVRFADVMCSEAFIDKDQGAAPLGAGPDDIDAAIGESVRLSLDILDGRRGALGMRGE